MDLTDQTKGQGQAGQAFEAVVHGGHVVEDFFHVQREVCRRGVELVREDIVQGALCPLDLGTEDGLATNVHRDEQVGVWQGPTDAIETPDPLVGC